MCGLGQSILLVAVFQILLPRAEGAPDSSGAITQPLRPAHRLQPGALSDHNPKTPGGIISSEWVVKLKTTTRDSYLGLGGVYHYDRPLDQSELFSIADLIAEDLPLEHAGHVTPFHGVFRLRYAPRKESDHGKLQVRRVDGIHRRLEELERSLDAHSSVVWVARQDPLVRHKRGVAMDFNDQVKSLSSG